MHLFLEKFFSTASIALHNTKVGSNFCGKFFPCHTIQIYCKPIYYYYSVTCYLLTWRILIYFCLFIHSDICKAHLISVTLLEVNSYIYWDTFYFQRNPIYSYILVCIWHVDTYSRIVPCGEKKRKRMSLIFHWSTWKCFDSIWLFLSIRCI